MRIAGSVAIVTGAAAGIGAATVRELVRRGATVVAADRSAVGPAEGVDAVRVDVADPAHADSLVTHALDRYGRLDAVVANAGIGHYGPFAEMPPERIAELLAVNSLAPLLLARAALPPMLAQHRGAVVLVTSIAGILLVPQESAYSASKAAVEAFARPLREELRGTGVTVSTVVPGVVDTGFFDARGVGYQRRRPRPVPPERVASALADAIERGADRVVVPGWFRLPIRIRGAAPGLYARLARRLG